MELSSLPWYDPRSVQGWALSIVFHVTMIGLTLMWLSDLHLVSQPDAFRWQVFVIDTTRPSTVQETTEMPREPWSSPPTPVAPSVSKPAPMQKTGSVPRQVVTPAHNPPSRNYANTRELSGAGQIQAAPHDEASPDVPTHITAPVQALRSNLSQTAARAPSMSAPPADERAQRSPSEPPPAAEFSARAEAPSWSPAPNGPTIAPDAVDAPAALVPPTSAPETSSSTAALSNMSSSVQETRMAKPDFSWLTDSLRNKVQETQRYSTVARLNGLEGRVVLRITVKENGELTVAITKSSGHDVLDQDALEQVKRLSPLPLPQPLGRAQQVLNLPIIYSLNQ